MRSNGTPQTDSNARQRRSAPLRVGLIAGLTLSIAIVAQQITGDPLGMLIVIIGLHIAGYYAARESGADSRRSALRAGLLGGLTAGGIIGLAFAAVTMLLSLDAERTARLQQESLQAMEQLWPAYSAIVRDEMTRDPNAFRASYLLSTVIATTCCSLILPSLGAAFGAVGGLFGAGARREPAE
jgi:hypothetical protein